MTYRFRKPLAEDPEMIHAPRRRSRKMAVWHSAVVAMAAVLTVGLIAIGGSRAPFRVTTYEIGEGVFIGTTYTLTLDQDLTADYFVIIRGASGYNLNSTTRAPNQNFARIDADPHSNFATVTAANELRMSRQAASSAWQGQVTVVEARADQAVSSFALLDVVEVSLGSGITAGSRRSAEAWSDINQVVLYGGIRGGGVATTAHLARDHLTAWAHIYPSGGSTINLQRMASGGAVLSGNTTFTIFVVEWGSEWGIQRARIFETAGGGAQIFFGDPGDRFVAGDWGITDGTDTPAIFRPSDLTFYFRHTLTQGVADSQFTWTGAGSGWLPVTGTFGLG